jgi:hypothetical protein
MRRIQLHYHNSGITVTGHIIPEKEKMHPELCDDVWNFLAKPQKCYCHHTISTGDYYQLKPTPPYERPQRFSNQTQTLGGGDVVMLCEIKPGEIFWRGYYMCVVYGDSTEPLTAGGPVLLKIDDECFDEFVKASKNIWHQYLHFHELGIVTVSRKED